MLFYQKYEDQQDVAAIVTAMTDKEQMFVKSTMEAVLSDPGIAQVILCIEEKNTWIGEALGSLTSDPRLKILRLPLAAPGAVRNQALSYVTMPWVAYCDGDDIWCRGKTLIQRAQASNKKCDFVGVDHYLTNERGKIRAFAFARHLPLPSSWMVRTEVMRKHPFNESLYQGECCEWWIRTHGTVSKVRCPRVLLRYRIRPSSLSEKTSSMRRKTKIVALANTPGVGTLIFLLTGFLWLTGRQEQYVWDKGWGPEAGVTHATSKPA